MSTSKPLTGTSEFFVCINYCVFNMLGILVLRLVAKNGLRNLADNGIITVSS
jgi:hypothetical protein